MKVFNWKYRYFKKKLKGIRCMIADLEFKRYKTFYVREQIRQEYDGLKSKLEILKTKIKLEREPGGLKETNADEFKRLEDEEIRFNEDIKKKESQMCQLDIEIYGAKASAELPDGHQGLNQTMEALRELAKVTKQYIIKEL